MLQAKKMLLGTAFVAMGVSVSAFAQTAQPADAGQMAAPSAQTAPPPQNIVAPAPTDPLVVKRNASAQASAEYKASKKASKQDLKATNKEAKAQYKEQVRNAKINKKADNQTANDDLKSALPDGPQNTNLQH
ncbi:hypothetical protein LJR029_000532 [Caballeronia sp. LjRoot29]|uniref:hypothetical protein n=1 Tax=Caballeronia sp. LjRoot29 TaxID=3342315 RepID=UPI003ECEE147